MDGSIEDASLIVPEQCCCVLCGPPLTCACSFTLSSIAPKARLLTPGMEPKPPKERTTAVPVKEAEPAAAKQNVAAAKTTPFSPLDLNLCGLIRNRLADVWAWTVYYGLCCCILLQPHPCGDELVACGLAEYEYGDALGCCGEQIIYAGACGTLFFHAA